MSAFFKSVLGIAVLSTAMIAGLGQTNEAQARPYGGYGYRGAYYGGYRGGYYAPRYYSGYRYNAYRPYYGGYYNSYGYPYYNNYYYGPSNYIGVGPVRVGW